MPDFALAEKLNIDMHVPAVIEKRTLPEPIPEKVEENPNEDMKKDFQFARRALKDVIEQGQDATKGVLNVAEDTDHPEAYVAVATLIKSVTDATKELVNIHKTRNQIANPGKGADLMGTQNINVDKAVFVGSTTDLLKRLENQIDESISE